MIQTLLSCGCILLALAGSALLCLAVITLVLVAM